MSSDTDRLNPPHRCILCADPVGPDGVYVAVLTLAECAALAVDLHDRDLLGNRRAIIFVAAAAMEITERNEALARVAGATRIRYVSQLGIKVAERPL
jgi:hypothetical protein